MWRLFTVTIVAMVVSWPCMAADDIVRVALWFRVDTAKGVYSDTLYFTQTEWAAVKPAEIAAAKQARVDAWLATIDPIDPALTKAQLEDWLRGVESQLAEMIALKDKLETDIGKLP